MPRYTSDSRATSFPVTREHCRVAVEQIWVVSKMRCFCQKCVVGTAAEEKILISGVTCLENKDQQLAWALLLSILTYCLYSGAYVKKLYQNMLNVFTTF